MDTPLSSPARRALTFGCALIMVVATTAVAAAQSEPAAEPDTAAAAEAAATPGKLKSVKGPKGQLGHRIDGIIEGGPGYIAVGGGTPTGLDHQPLVWLSEDGLTWFEQPLFGDAMVGSMHGVAALPDGGYVAAGYDFAPETVRKDMVHVQTWHSADGFRWQKLPADASYPGSMIWDVTATPTGVALAGCIAGFHCDTGRVWTSTDGMEWDLQDDIAMAPYEIASNTAGELVVGGEDDAYDLVNGQAAVAGSSDGWNPSVVATGDSQIAMVAPWGDGFVASGRLNDRQTQEVVGSAVQTSSDGVQWKVHEPKRLQGVAVSDGTATDELIVLTGIERTDDGYVPVALWGNDPDEFLALKLPKKSRSLDTEFSGAHVTDDGTRLFLFGTEKGRPAIWTAPIK